MRHAPVGLPVLAKPAPAHNEVLAHESERLQQLPQKAPLAQPKEARADPSVAVLDLSDMEPGEVASMLDSASPEVTELILKGCQLETLPDTIGRLGKLERLDVSENELEALPAAIKGCVLLTSLDASDNALKALPVELGHLVNLKELLVYKNKISAVPEELGKLVQLETLNLFNNMARPHPSRGRCRL